MLPDREQASLPDQRPEKMANFASRCTWVMMLGLILLAARNFGSVHGLRTHSYHINMLHAEDNLPSFHMVTSDIDGRSAIPIEMLRTLNSGRKLLQRPTPPSKPSPGETPKLRQPGAPAIG